MPKETNAKPIDTKGSLLVTRTVILNRDYLVSPGFGCVMHSNDKELSVTLVKIKDKEFIKKGDIMKNEIMVWRLDREAHFTTENVIMRKEATTIGFGKIINVQ